MICHAVTSLHSPALHMDTCHQLNISVTLKLWNNIISSMKIGVVCADDILDMERCGVLKCILGALCGDNVIL